MKTKKFKEISNEWIELKKLSVKYPTIAKYRVVIDTQLAHQFNDYTMEQFNEDIIIAYFNKLSTKENYANSTLLSIRYVLRAIINYSHQKYKTNNCSFELIKIAKKQRQINTLSNSQKINLSNYCFNNFQPISIAVAISLYTGLRIGEICALKWEDINFEDYNLIISAAGNHNLNRWINSWIQNNKIKVPVVYLWNEVYGIGNHAAYIKYGNCGCYECFFDRDEETGELYDKTSYCMRGQIITESAGGCGKTYVPYGNLVSLKTMLLCLKMVKNIFEENLDDNLLISLKGDSDYLEKHNLETSGRYLRQQEQIKILTGKQFVNINCGVCNDCNGK